MMLVAAVAGALVVVGALGIVVGLRGVPEAEPAARPSSGGTVDRFLR